MPSTTDPTTTDPPTLAERLRDLEAELGTLDDAIVTHAADVFGLLDPHVVEMVERVLAEDLPDGWTATAASYIVLTEEATGREFVATYCGQPITDQFTWWRACAPTDDPDRQVGANALAQLIELVTA